MKNEFDLRRMIAAAGVKLDELAKATGIDESTLSRAQNGYRLSAEKQARVASALAAALDHQTREVRLAKRAVARIVESTQTAAA
jgi:transcriptional regulator with XRE-family HTH domain